MTRIVRIIRLIRLIRIVKLYKQAKLAEKAREEKEKNKRKKKAIQLRNQQARSSLLKRRGSMAPERQMVSGTQGLINPSELGGNADSSEDKQQRGLIPKVVRNFFG